MDINIFNRFRFLAEVSTNLPKIHYFGQFKDHIWKEKSKLDKWPYFFIFVLSSKLFFIISFIFENCQNSFSLGPPFDPFWSAKHLNIGGESLDIRILSCSIQETYRLRKVKIRFYFFCRVEKQICLISWFNNFDRF